MRGSRYFCWGRGPGPSARKQKTALTTTTYFKVLQRVPNGYFKENYNFPRFQRGSNIFQGRGPTFSRGVQMLISIETHIASNFPGGSGPPIDPLWICAYNIWKSMVKSTPLIFGVTNYDQMSTRGVKQPLHAYLYMYISYCNEQLIVFTDVTT